MKSSFALLFLLALTGNAIAHPGLSLKLVHPDHYYDSVRNETYMNHDSVLVDSLATSPTYLEYYATNGWGLDFKYYVIHRPVASYDTIIELPWTAIDTTYVALRTAFAALETKYGTFYLEEVRPDSYDSVAPGNRSYALLFDNYACVDSVVAALELFPDLDTTDGFPDAGFGGYPAWADGIPNDRSLVPGILTTAISPDPDPFYPSVWSNLPSNWHSRGWGWADYSIHCPMAWEITIGKPNVVIADHDWWTGSAESYPHLDIIYRKTATPNGNWLLFSPTASSGDPQFPGDGVVTSTFPLASDHGTLCLPLAISLANNDNLTSPPDGGLAGVAPQCTGIALDYYNQIDGATVSDYLLKVDVDGLANNGLGSAPLVTLPDIFNYSYHSTNGSVYEKVIDAGSVEVASGGNVREDYPDPGPAFPSAYVYSDPSNPSDGSKDVKIIAVGALEDGPIADCPGIDPDWTDPDGTLHSGGVQRHPHYTSGYEWFEEDWNYSHGTDKFNTSTIESTRVAAKEDAHIDLIAPGESVMTPIAGDPLYTPNMSGTSQSSPEVAGVVGLMMSIQKGLGQTGRNVQKKAYDILTFTADKVQDIDNITAGLPEPSTFNYTLETNDALHRSWEQRMGFGKVNAFRAVANSIPFMGAYSYSSSSSNLFSGDTWENENGQYLMHFGAWKNATYHWYDYIQVSGTWMGGGNIIPNQAPTWPYNNQGQTLINSTSGIATVLTIGDSPSWGNKDILAIDGNVIGDSAANNKINTTSNGKILITGYVQNVEIDATTHGPVKMDDLIINGNGGTSHNWSNITINSGNGSTDSSEIYGLVQLQDYAQLNVNGYLTVQPGGEIEMEGNKNFEISSGGHVKMNASTTIASASTQEVIVDNGATLEISGLLPVNVLCEIDVKSGGTLVIDDGADLQLNQFLIEQGGTFTCNPGGRLTLNLALYNYCYGDFNFLSASGESRITLTGGVSTCGTVDQSAGIICQGNLASQGNAYMTMVDVDDSDVYMTGVNVPKYLFAGDYFSSNSGLTANGGLQYWYGPATLLYLYNTTSIVSESSVRGAYISGCRFFDQDLTPTYGHIFDGLYTSLLDVLHVSGSAFYNLNFGCETWNCPNVSYEINSYGINVDAGTGSSVGPLQIGILDQLSGSLYCSNTIENCTLGISAENDMFGTLCDNTFETCSKYCLSTQVSGKYELRDNNLSLYPLYGIYSVGMGNNVVLRDDGTNEFGRNILTAGTHGSAASADLARVNSGQFSVSCGLNTFGAPSVFQILNLDAPSYTINVGGNDWLGTPPVRSHNCSTPGTPINEAGSATPYCGNEVDMDPPTCSIVCCAIPVDPNPPIAAWFTLDSASSEFTSAYWTAHGMLLTDTLDAGIRATKARDELWAASLTDSFATYIPRVLTDYIAVLADPLAPDTLKASLWMLKGQVFEMLGEPDSALVCYSTISSSYHQFGDSVYALWDVQRLDLPDSLVISSDSAPHGFDQREYADLLAMIDTISDTSGGGEKIADGHAADTSSFQVTVHPNPVAGIVKICVEDLPGGIPVTVDVVNQMGQSVAMLYNATPEAELGLCLSLDCSTLPSGIYYADLQTDGLHHAVKFSVEH